MGTFYMVLKVAQPIIVLNFNESVTLLVNVKSRTDIAHKVGSVWTFSTNVRNDVIRKFPFAFAFAFAN